MIGRGGGPDKRKADERRKGLGQTQQKKEESPSKVAIMPSKRGRVEDGQE